MCVWRGNFKYTTLRPDSTNCTARDEISHVAPDTRRQLPLTGRAAPRWHAIYPNVQFNNAILPRKLITRPDNAKHVHWQQTHTSRSLSLCVARRLIAYYLHRDATVCQHAQVFTSSRPVTPSNRVAYSLYGMQDAAKIRAQLLLVCNLVRSLIKANACCLLWRVLNGRFTHTHLRRNVDDCWWLFLFCFCEQFHHPRNDGSAIGNRTQRRWQK